jgi:iron complex transport system substrate-binding protein
VAVAVFRAETLQETLDTMGAVGERCGEVERARSLVESLRKRLDDVSRRVAGASRTRVLFALQTEPIIASGRGTLPSDLLELAGGENVVTEPRYPRLSLEAVLESSPDVIVQSRMDVPENRSEPPEIRFWERWPELPAVRDRRVHLLVGDAPLRPGPRVAEAAEQLAAILHPEAHP